MAALTKIGFALSTNWCNRRLATGEAIVDEAQELGFEALELGFHTTRAQVDGFRRLLDEMPIGSVHAFCPVPVSAPQGYPELYQLADADSEARKMARLQVQRNVAFAAELGADAVVLHAGRVAFSGRVLNRNLDSEFLRAKLFGADCQIDSPTYRKLLGKALLRRRAFGLRRLEAFYVELDALVPDLERQGVTLALENLPYLEGFPDETELGMILQKYRGAPVRGWFDTGHDLVRRKFGWTDAKLPEAADFAGMHLNDVKDFCDDHLAPGGGSVDFAVLASFAASVRHVVFEPNSAVPAEDLRRSLADMRRRWAIL